MRTATALDDDRLALAYASVFRASPVGMGLSDEDGLLVDANEALCQLLGRERADVIGRSVAEFTHPDDPSARDSGSLIQATPDGIARFEKRYVRPDGSVRWAWLTVTHAHGPEGELWTLAHVHDVTERRATEDALRDSETNLNAVARVIQRIQSGEDARQTIVDAAVEIAGADFVSFVEAKPRPAGVAVTATNYTELVGASVEFGQQSATIDVYRSGQAQFFADAAANPTVSPDLLELTRAKSLYLLPVRAADRTIAVLIVAWRQRVASLADRRAAAVALLAAQAGVALRQATLLDEIRHLALTDPLTGVENRRGWDLQLASAMKLTRVDHAPLTVAVIDLDHFKRYNDTHGHPAGDDLLLRFARAVRATLREDDVLARWGGEEFALALLDCTPAEVRAVLTRVLESVPDRQTCSIGYANLIDGESANDLMFRADRALYAAKHAGRNRITAAADPT